MYGGARVRRPEVDAVLKETRRELSLKGKPPLAGPLGPLDPALWGCVCLFELRLELADKALVELPPQVHRRPRWRATLRGRARRRRRCRDRPATVEVWEKPHSAARRRSSLQVSRLHDLTTLILSGNALRALPDEVGQLSKLKNFEAVGNGLTALPDSFAQLKQLQVVDVT